MEDLTSALYSEEEKAAIEQALEKRPMEADRFELYEIHWLLPINFTARLGRNEVRVSFNPREAGFAFNFPESSFVPLDRPQLLTIGAGYSRYFLRNATPSKFGAASYTIFILTFALITALSIGLGFNLAGYRPPLRAQFAVAVVWYCSAVLIFLALGFLLNAAGSFVMALGMDLRNNFYLLSLFIPAMIVALFVLSRSLLGAYSGLYGVRRWGVVLFLIPAFILSGVIGPFIMVPALYLINELGSVMDQLI